jgi:hypothetical protein
VNLIKSIKRWFGRSSKNLPMEHSMLTPAQRAAKFATEARVIKKEAAKVLAQDTHRKLLAEDITEASQQGRRSALFILPGKFEKNGDLWSYFGGHEVLMELLERDGFKVFKTMDMITIQW